MFPQAVGGYLADYKDKENFLQYLLKLSENVFDGGLSVWVYAEVSKGHCSSFKNTYIIAEQDCHLKLLPFICERGNLLSTWQSSRTGITYNAN